MSKRNHCEFQGEDHPLMFHDQRNHIRINADQRQHFRGKKAVLVIREAEMQMYGTFPDGGTYTSDPSLSTLGFMYRDETTRWLKDHMARTGEKLRIMYHYELMVEDPDLAGAVFGKYANSSIKKATVIRRIKRMMGAGLEVVDTTPRSRAEILRLWKIELAAEAKAYVLDIHARATARHLAAKAKPVNP
jgi:hypothetical protein